MKRENHQIVMCIYSCLLPHYYCLSSLAYCLITIASLLLPIASLLLPLFSCLLPHYYCLITIASLLSPLAYCLITIASLLQLLKYRPIHFLNQRNRNYLDAKGFIFVSSVVFADYNFFESKFFRFRNALINSIHCTNLST